MIGKARTRKHPGLELCCDRRPSICVTFEALYRLEKYIADPRILSSWTETDLQTDSLHQSDAPLGLTWCS